MDVRNEQQTPVGELVQRAVEGADALSVALGPIVDLARQDTHGEGVHMGTYTCDHVVRLGNLTAELGNAIRGIAAMLPQAATVAAPAPDVASAGWEAQVTEAADVVLQLGLPSRAPEYASWNARLTFPNQHPARAVDAFEPTTAALALASRAMLLAYEDHGVGWADHAGEWTDVMTGDRLGIGVLFSMLTQWEDAANAMYRAAKDLAARLDAAQEKNGGAK